jgi:cytoskeletal protein CcmA (bactofilin family)
MPSPSTIGGGTTVRGNIHSEGDLDIYGRVEGSVVARGDLLIGAGALVQSDVSGRRVVVQGAVAGNVTAEEAIVLEDGARVVGDLGAPRIGIRPGALVRGNVSTEGGLPAPKPRAAAAATRGVGPMTTQSGRAPAAREQQRPEPTRPAARPLPPPARPAPAPARPATPPRVEAVSHEAEPTRAAPAAEGSSRGAGAPPPPVVPSLGKGAKGSLRRKGAR